LAGYYPNLPADANQNTGKTWAGREKPVFDTEYPPVMAALLITLRRLETARVWSPDDF
jgi:hypothetical protein